MEEEFFDDEHFSPEQMTARVNNEPFRPGQVGKLGIFEEEGVDTDYIRVEEANGALALIEPTERGGPGETTGEGDRAKRLFSIEHFQRDDSVKAAEVQNVRSFGSETMLETVGRRVDAKINRHLSDIDMTLEHSRIGALKGLIASKSGKVLHDLYSVFGIAVPAPVVLGLGVEVADLSSVIKSDVVYSIEDSLDMHYTRIHALCGRDFHTSMWAQKAVRETFMYNEGAKELRDVPDKFEFGGVTWERYRTGRSAKKDNGDAGYIADNEARVFPVGVSGGYITRFGPGDFEEVTNTIGLPRYARQWPMANGKGRHIEVQSNFVNLCLFPGALR